VWDALEDTPEEAAHMTMRSDLLIAIGSVCAAGGLPKPRQQKDSASRSLD
jgi:predicted XRE-type DNA-binding protein